MKKRIVLVAMLGVMFSLNAANGDEGGGGVKNSVSSRIQTSDDLQLSVQVIDSLDMVEVDITGDIMKWATLVLTNTKGEEVYFKLIEDLHSPLSLKISTEDLKPGFYFIQLDCEQEIRILKIRIH